jgi:hypothetical protein
MAAVQISDRLIGFLDQVIARVEQLEGDRDDSIGEDVHRWMFAAGKRLRRYAHRAKHEISRLNAIIVLPLPLQAFPWRVCA